MLFMVHAYFIFQQQSRAGIAYMAEMLHWDVGWLYESSYTHPTALSPLNKRPSTNKYNTFLNIRRKDTYKSIIPNVTNRMPDLKWTREAAGFMIRFCCHWCMSLTARELFKVINCSFYKWMNAYFATLHLLSEKHKSDSADTFFISCSFLSTHKVSFMIQVTQQKFVFEINRWGIQ